MGMDESLYEEFQDFFERTKLEESLIEKFNSYIDYDGDEKEFLNTINKSNTIEDLYKFEYLYNKLIKSEKNEYARKLIEFLYKVAGARTFRAISGEYSSISRRHIDSLKEIGVTNEVIYTMYLESTIENKYLGRLYFLDLKNIEEECEKNPEDFKKIEKNYELSEKALILLKSAYCATKNIKKDEIYSIFLKDLENYEIDNIGNIFLNVNKDFQEEINSFIKSNKSFEEASDLILKLKSCGYNKEEASFIIQMAIINVNNSNIIKRLLKLFGTTYCSAFCNMAIPENSSEELNKIFDIPFDEHLAWYVGKNYEPTYHDRIANLEVVLKKKYNENPEGYKRAIALSELGQANYLMFFIMDDENREEYIKAIEKNVLISLKRALNQKKSNIQEEIDLICEFILGNKSFNEIEKAIDTIYGDEVYRYKGPKDIVADGLELLKRAGDEDFFGRAFIVISLINEGGIVRYLMNKKYDSSLENDYQKKNYLDIYYLYEKYNLSYEREMQFVNDLIETIRYEFFDDYISKLLEKDRETFINEIANLFPSVRGILLQCIFSEKTLKNAEDLSKYFGDSSKGVRDKIVFCFKDCGFEYYDIIKAKLSGKKVSERETSLRIIEEWKQNNIIPASSMESVKEDIKALLSKEKNQKLRNLANSILDVEEDSEISNDEMVKNIVRGSKKSSFEWLELDNIPEMRFIAKEDEGDMNYLVHSTNILSKKLSFAEKCSEEYIRALLLCYSKENKPFISKDAQRLSKEINKEDLEMLANYVFDKWVESGEENRKKWAAFFGIIYGGNSIIDKVKREILDLSKKKKLALVGDLIKALALTGTPSALLVVDGISRKFKYTSVKEKAKEALVFAANEMGITQDELSDRIVPNLGFDKYGYRRFSYGEREFTVVLTHDMELSIYDEDGKKYKKMPVPGKRDDEEIAKESYSEFKALKKEIKDISSIQKIRFEAALSKERRWKISAWKENFVHNPIMNIFAIGLIWGEYKDGKLVNTFRYLGDGTFTTIDDEELDLTDDSLIGLIHPLELTTEELEGWKNQLEDYEINQPINQLNRKIFKVTDDEALEKSFTGLGGRVVRGNSFAEKLLAQGWKRGDNIDSGYYCELLKEDLSLNIGVQLNVESISMYYMDEESTIYDMRFYDIEKTKKIMNTTGYIKESDAVTLCEVPEKFFSEAVYDVEKASEGYERVEEKWKEDIWRN